MTSSRVSDENRFRLWRAESLGGVEFLSGAYRRHRFPRHFHDGFVFQVVTEGVNWTAAGNAQLTATPGALLIIPPFTVHDGASATSTALAYRAAYPSEQYVRDTIAAAHPNGYTWLRARARLVEDQALVTHFLQMHECAEEDPANTALPARMAEFFDKLLKRHANSGERSDDPSAADDGIDRAIQLTHDAWSESVTLDQLAAAAALSRFHFLRAFQRRTGLTPHSYLVNLRVEHARHALAGGAPIAAVARRCGFSDQSHLTRHFKRIVGLTPGQYRLAG